MCDIPRCYQDKSQIVQILHREHHFAEHNHSTIEFLEKFLEENIENKKFFIDSKNKNHYLFDMSKYVKEKLLKQIRFVYDVKIDTYLDEKRFFSYRRSCHKGEKEMFGTQFSGIMLS